MDINTFAERCAQAGLEVVRISQKSVTIQNAKKLIKLVKSITIKNLHKQNKIDRFIDDFKCLPAKKNHPKKRMATKNVKEKRRMLWDLLSIFIIVGCCCFITYQIKQHTESVEKMQNELAYEKLIYEIQTGVRK